MYYDVGNLTCKVRTHSAAFTSSHKGLPARHEFQDPKKGVININPIRGIMTLLLVVTFDSL
jgi:hypothetical protein